MDRVERVVYWHAVWVIAVLTGVGVVCATAGPGWMAAACIASLVLLEVGVRVGYRLMDGRLG